MLTPQLAKVPLKWNSKMESPVPMITEPSFASLDYEQFGEVTIAPLTMNLAGQLLALGRAEMAAVLVYALAAPAYCAASRNPVKAQNKLEVESARENTFST